MVTDNTRDLERERQDLLEIMNAKIEPEILTRIQIVNSLQPPIQQPVIEVSYQGAGHADER